VTVVMKRQLTEEEKKQMGQLANSWVNWVGSGCWPRSVGGPRDVRQARFASAVVRWILEPPCATRPFPARPRPTTGTLEGH